MLPSITSEASAGVESVKVFDRTCDAVVRYTCKREKIIAATFHASHTVMRRSSALPRSIQAVH